MFLADGAPWIWDRIDGIVKAAGIDKAHVKEVLDFYHAAHQISLALTYLVSDSERPAIYRRLRSELKAGRRDAVWSELMVLAWEQPSASGVWTEIEYILKHGEAGRLDYAIYKSNGLPRGSGASESTIRRVINLRLKSNAMFWREENAESVFAVRALWLSERWDERLTAVRASLRLDARRDWSWQPRDRQSELKLSFEESELKLSFEEDVNSSDPELPQPLTATAA